MIPLQSYSNSPTDEKYSGLDYIEFKISEVDKLIWLNNFIGYI